MKLTNYNPKIKTSLEGPLTPVAPKISSPSTPLDAKGRPYALVGTLDLKSGRAQQPISHSGPPLGTECGSPTYFQSNRNQLTAMKIRAHIAHLTYPKDRNLKKAYMEATYAEENFTRLYGGKIKDETKAGQRDDFVPPTLQGRPGQNGRYDK